MLFHPPPLGKCHGTLPMSFVKPKYGFPTPTKLSFLPCISLITGRAMQQQIGYPAQPSIPN